MVRQLNEEAERAERREERADAAERKRQEQLAHEAGAAAAKEMKAQLEAQVTELRTVLTSVLARPPRLSFAELKQSAVAAPLRRRTNDRGRRCCACGSPTALPGSRRALRCGHSSRGSRPSCSYAGPTGSPRSSATRTSGGGFSWATRARRSALAPSRTRSPGRGTWTTCPRRHARGSTEGSRSCCGARSLKPSVTSGPGSEEPVRTMHGTLFRPQDATAHCGNHSSVAVLVSWVTPLPSGFMVNRSRPPVDRTWTKMIFIPSGE
jgi:hypothetical protein